MSRLVRCVRPSERGPRGGGLTSACSRQRRTAESESHGRNVRAFAAEALFIRCSRVASKSSSRSVHSHCFVHHRPAHARRNGARAKPSSRLSTTFARTRSSSIGTAGTRPCRLAFLRSTPTSRIAIHMLMAALAASSLIRRYESDSANTQRPTTNSCCLTSCRSSEFITSTSNQSLEPAAVRCDAHI